MPFNEYLLSFIAPILPLFGYSRDEINILETRQKLFEKAK